jgi:hypothetical protein
VQGLVDYLNGIADQELVTPGVARLAWQAWTALSNSMSNALLVPDACPGPNGELLYTWDRDGHHLELEIFSDAPAEFFYENDGSGEAWEAAFVIGEPVPPEALDRLRLFV